LSSGSSCEETSRGGKDFFVHLSSEMRLTVREHMESQPERLVEAACRGDQSAANRLVELFYERIYAFLRRLAGNDADAADLTQQTFGRLWKALPSYAGKASFGSWLHGSAHHVYVDWRRSNHRLESRSEEWWLNQADAAPGPRERSTSSDLAARLFASVDLLVPELRDTVHLHYYQELTLQETADALGIAVSTVKYRLRQALSELTKRLAEQPNPGLTRINLKLV